VFISNLNNLRKNKTM